MGTKEENALHRLFRRARSLSAGSQDRQRERLSRKDWDEGFNDKCDPIFPYQMPNLGDGEGFEHLDEIWKDFTKKPSAPPLYDFQGARQKFTDASDQNDKISRKDLMEILLENDQKHQENLTKAVEKISMLNTKMKNFEKTKNTDVSYISAVEPPPFFNDIPQAYGLNSAVKRVEVFSKPFTNIPQFKGEKSYPVRTFLELLNMCVLDTAMKIPEETFCTIVLQKLSHDVRSNLAFSCDPTEKNCAALYDALLSLYDFSDNDCTALVKLFNLKPSADISSFASFYDNCMKHLRLAGGSPSDKGKHFLIALRNILNDRLRIRVDEKVHSYRTRGDNSYPPVRWLLNLISPHREEIESYIHEHSRPKAKFREIRKVNDDTSQNKLQCSHCQMTNHTVDNCFKLQNSKNKDKPCQKCGRQGHVAEGCKTRCRKCHSIDHVSATCDVYKGIQATQTKCPYCYEVVHLALFHPLASSVLRKN